MLLLLHGVAATTAMRPGLVPPSISSLLETNPSPGLISLNGTEPWNSKEEGFMWVRLTPTDLSATSGDQYVMDMNDGGSSPSAGMRIREGDSDTCGNRYRDDSGDLSSQRLNRNPAIEDTLKTIGFSWSNSQGLIRIISGGLYEEGSFAPDGGSFASAGFSRLYIGSRNGGSDAFTGTLDAYEVGSSFLSFSQLMGRMTHANTKVIAGAGQSLMDDHFDSTESGGTPGFNVFVAQGAALYSGAPEVLAVNGSTGSSALSNLSNGASYWWHRTNQEAGPAYSTFLTTLQTQGLTPSWVFWAQGEEDSHYINGGGPTRAQYKADLLALFTMMRNTLNTNLQIGIQGIGRRSSGYSNTGGIQTIREIQQELAAENSWIHILGYSYDTTLTDEVHLSDAGYTSVATRMIRNAADIDGESVSGSLAGPSISGASRTGTSVTVTIAHDGGSDFTPTSGIVGFRFFDDGSEISISSTVRTDATTITLTLASAPSGIETLYYCYDDASDITNANVTSVVRDNSSEALPLIPTKITL